jgi:DNA-binding LacI/PurR family transcriptional regulator
VHPTDGYDVQAGMQAAQAIAEAPVGERPTAVFAINGLIAIGLQRGLQLAGSISHKTSHRGLRRSSRGVDRSRAADHDP